MGMHLDLGDGDQDDGMIGSINTTPLVDVMLVLLIIFLITIPVATQTVPLTLPKENNQPTQTLPGTVTLAVDRSGQVWWNEERVEDRPRLIARLEELAARTPQPSVHLRGDKDTAYEHVGRVLALVQQAGIGKVSFITAPADP